MKADVQPASPHSESLDDFTPLELSTLVKPFTVAEFRETFPHRFFVHHDDPARFAPITSIPELRDVYMLAQAYHDPVSVWLPSALADRARSFGKLLRAPDALPHYEKGALLQFNKVERWVPRLEMVLRSLELELALPIGTATCSLFASTVGGEVFPHFDADPAFSLQLSGSKRWWVAPQKLIEEPLHNHVCGTNAPQIAQYFDGALPEGVPGDAQAIEMRPGSLLFIPRGYLHSTLSHESSFAVTFDLHIPHWTTIVTNYLTSRLNKSVAWRRHALGLTDSEPAAVANLSALLDDLKGAVSELCTEPALAIRHASPGLLPGGPKEYRRAAAAKVDLEHHEEEGWQVRVSHPELGRSDIEIAPEMVHLCRWMVRPEARFIDADAVRHAPGLQRNDVSALLSALVETGVLQAADVA